MRPKLVAVALSGGILLLGAGSVVAATLPSWTTHGAGTVASSASSPAASSAPASSPKASPAAAKPSSLPSAPSSAAPSRTQAMPHAADTITYIVKSGDTLSGIAEWFSLHGYAALYAANASVIGANPNLIIPGEHITISHGVMELSGAGK
jgi:resuscitation-promoting factor RpfA